MASMSASQSFIEVSVLVQAEAVEGVTEVLLALGARGVVEEEATGQRKVTAYFPNDAQAEARMEAAVAEIRREAATQQQRLQGMLQQLFTHAAHAAAPAHAAAHAAPYAPSVPAPPLAEPPPHWLPARRPSAPGRPAAATAAGGAAAYAPGADPDGRPQSAGLALQPRPGSAAAACSAIPLPA
jgi:hypothetical protein